MSNLSLLSDFSFISVQRRTAFGKSPPGSRLPSPALHFRAAWYRYTLAPQDDGAQGDAQELVIRGSGLQVAEGQEVR